MRWSLAAFVVCVAGCLNPAPHALIQLDDPNRLAANAVAIAVGNEAGVFRRIGSSGEFPVSFTVSWPRSDAVELLTFEALDANDAPLARTRALVSFPVGTVPNLNLALAAACEQPNTVGQACVLSDGSSVGTCVASRCVAEECGDGKVDDDEECDDGNLLTDDDCTPACTFNVCGDGFFNPAVEDCDDGNDVSTDECVITPLGAGFECREAFCGDGFVWAEVEECDPAAADSPADCLDTCRINTCGDTIVLAGIEDCDDGNENPNDGCDACAAVTWTPVLRLGDAPLEPTLGSAAPSATTARLVDAVDMAWVAPNDLLILAFGGDQLFQLNLTSGRLRPLTSRGDGTPSTGDGGFAATATLNGAQAVAAFVDGTIAIADTNSHRIRLIDSATGVIDTLLGSGLRGTFGGGNGQNIMDSPRGVAFAPNGDVFFTDSGNRRFRRIERATGLVSTFQFTDDGFLGTTNGLDLTVTDAGAIFVADPVTASINRIRYMPADRVRPPSFDLGADDTLSDITVGPDGLIYVAANDNDRLQRFDPNDIPASIELVAGVSGDGYSPDGTPATSATFNGMQSVAVADDGTVYVLEADSGLIRSIDGDGNLTTAFGASSLRPNDGAAGTALSFGTGPFGLEGLFGVDADSAGNLYFTDAGNRLVYRLSPTGDLGRIAGLGSTLEDPDDRGDNGPAIDAVFAAPLGIDVDPNGNMYVVDYAFSGTGRLRRIDTGGTITTVAAGLTAPLYVAANGTGDVFIADAANIERVGGGVVFTAGDFVGAVDFGPDDDLYFIESTSGQFRIRRATAASNYSTIEIVLRNDSMLSDFAFDGGGALYYTVASEVFRFVEGSDDVSVAGGGSGRGDGGPATVASLSAESMFSTSGIAAAGSDIYVIDFGLEPNGVLRRIDGSGTISTVLGAVNLGDGNDDAAYLDRPTAVTALDDGEWLVVENERVRVVDGTGARTLIGLPGGTPIDTTARPVASAARLSEAAGATRESDAVYVTESGAGRVLRINLVNPADESSWTVEEYLTGFTTPTGIASGPAPNGNRALFVSDAGSQTVTRLDLVELSTTVIVGSGAFTDQSDGLPGRLNQPGDLAVASDGSVYVADRLNNRVRQVRCFTDRPCEVATLLGDAVRGRLTDGDRADGLRLEGPTGLSIDPTGNLLVVSARDAALLIASADGSVDGASPALSLFASGTGADAECLVGGALDGTGAVGLVDRCRGAFIELQRSSQ
ncbi:MAG: DUF4215 domain-containing protein [Myxococcota bacterium]